MFTCLVNLVVPAGQIISAAAAGLASFNDLKEGPAILIGGLAGFGTVAWQTSRGFRDLQASQRNQSELDRIAREQAARLAEDAKDRDMHREMRALAAALQAEIWNILPLVDTSGEQLRDWAAQAHLLAEEEPRTKIQMRFPRWSTAIYDANIDKLGLLDPDLAADIVYVYTTAKSRPQADELLYYDAALWFHTLSKSYPVWKVELTAVADRLSVFRKDLSDPGPGIIKSGMAYRAAA